MARTKGSASGLCESLPMASETVESDSLMLEALRRRQPVSLGLVRGFLDKLRAIGAMPHPVEERRTVARLDCDVQVVMLLPDDRALGARVTDISLFGLGLEAPEEVPKGTAVRLLLAHDEGMEEVHCRVAGPGPHGVGCRLVYHQDAESLSRSWVCNLLRELGYSLDHLHQRRAFIRVKTDLPVRIEGPLGELAGRVVDLGVGGALLACQRPLPSEGEVKLRFEPPGQPAFTLPAQPLPPREQGLQCLQFPHLDNDQYQRLGHCVRNVIESLGHAPEAST